MNLSDTLSKVNGPMMHFTLKKITTTLLLERTEYECTMFDEYLKLGYLKPTTKTVSNKPNLNQEAFDSFGTIQ